MAHGVTVYRVEPEGWWNDGKLSFTFEVRSGAVPGGQVAEFRGSGIGRHFLLVVDPASVDLDGAAGFRFSSKLKDVLQKKIAEQAARPGGGAVPFYVTAGCAMRRLRRAAARCTVSRGHWNRPSWRHEGWRSQGWSWSPPTASTAT